LAKPLRGALFVGFISTTMDQYDEESRKRKTSKWDEVVCLAK